MVKTKVTSTSYEVENDDGSTREVTQYRTTVPKPIAEAMRLSGATIEWDIASADSVKISVLERETDDD